MRRLNLGAGNASASSGGPNRKQHITMLGNKFQKCTADFVKFVSSPYVALLNS